MDRRILVVDDSDPICRQLSELLARPDRQIKVAQDGTSAMEWLLEGNFSLVITDLRLPDIDGLEIVREIHRRSLPISAIVLTGHASVDSAVEAMKLGAYDYLYKPIDPMRLDLLVDQALKDRALRDEVETLRRRGVSRKVLFGNLLGQSPRMREVLARVARAASSECTVLIAGETGTGKELVAQALHQGDPVRNRGPMIAVNCAALPEPLLESELFGHERGAFTGADRQKAGRFEAARGGTLFLDEVGEMPAGMQAKLLRVLQDGKFERVGGSEAISVDARVVAATHVDLEAAVASGHFRRDLYYRLNVVRVELPPLRDRPEDIPLLVNHFLQRLEERKYPRRRFSADTLSRLARYEWPGNVRELEHLVEQLVVTTPGAEILPEDLPDHLISTREEPFSLQFDLGRPLQDITDELTERIERAYLVRVLETHQGRIDRCSEHCGLSRRSISEKLRKYSIDKSDFKPHCVRQRQLALGD